MFFHLGATFPVSFFLILLRTKLLRGLIFLLFDFISLVALSCCSPFVPVYSASSCRSLSPAKLLCTETAQKAAFISVAARPGGKEFKL